MAHWCESCGQELPTGEMASEATWLVEPGTDQQSFAKPAGAKQSGQDKKLLMAVVSALIIWGLFVGLGRIVTPDDSIDEQAAAKMEQARLDQEAEVAAEAEAAATQSAEAEAAATEAAEAAPVEIAEVAGDYGAADAAPGFPVASDDGEARTVVSVQVERLQRQFDRRDSAAFVAYRSAEGVVVVDLGSGMSVITELEPGVTAIYSDAHLLRSGASTFAVNTETLEVSRVAENSGVVVSDTLDGHTYLVDSGSLSGQAALVEVVADGEYGFHRLPSGGLQIQPVDGLGILAVPNSPAGETLIAGVDTFLSLSENRVLTGTSNALLEQVCSTEDQCELVVANLASGEQHAVPSSFVRFGDQYSLAPNGHALLRYSQAGFAEVYVTGTESILWVVGTGMHAPAWGPNSDFIAWIDRIGDPKLKFMFPDEPDWLAIDLRDLGAPPPASPELIVFTSETSPTNES